jgi:dipeptidyl aminopeptidase/acylaminoacyl peptidase
MQKVNFSNSKGQNLVGNLFLPEGDGKFPAAIFVHGYRSDKNGSKAKSFTEILPKKGIAFLVIDLSGRGESDGKFEDSTITQYIDDLKSAIDYVSTLEQINSGKIGVIGSSLGGIISLQELSKDSRPKALVLLSPVSYFPYKNKAEFSEEGVKEWKEKGHTYTESKRFGKMKLNYSFYEDSLQYNDISVYETITIPALIIHGTADESVRIEDSRILAKKFGNMKLIELEGADHGYSNPDDFNKMINETARFLQEVLK